MRVFWTTNTFSSEVSKIFNARSLHPVSWVDAMSERLAAEQDIELAIACPSKLKDVKKSNNKNIIYYYVPDNITCWRKVIEDFRPEIIHAYGTEHSHNLNLIQSCTDIPIVISLQGILYAYERFYYAGLDFSEMIRYTPIRDLFRPSGFFTGRLDFKNRSKNEILQLKRVKYVEGRSNWDRVQAININPKLHYYSCPRMLRKVFYECNAWDISQIDRHTIFVTQGSYPIKGLHFAFEAVSVLKEKYSDVRLVVTGQNLFRSRNFIEKVKTPGYQRYLIDLAHKLDIVDRIQFTGYMDATAVSEMLRKAHVSLLPSAIENAPNSIAEAMIVGTPCVASFVGGNMDMISDGVNGMLYCYNEPLILADKISKIFEDDDLAKSISENARDTAMNRHNPNKLVNNLLSIYRSIIADFNG